MLGSFYVDCYNLDYYVECRSAKSRYAEYRGFQLRAIVMLIALWLNVVTSNLE